MTWDEFCKLPAHIRHDVFSILNSAAENHHDDRVYCETQDALIGLADLVWKPKRTITPDLDSNVRRMLTVNEAIKEIWGDHEVSNG